MKNRVIVPRLFLTVIIVNAIFIIRMNTQIKENIFTGPDSSSGKASSSGSGGRRFDPRPGHTKGVKNGTGSSLADARNKRVVPGRYKKAGKYLLRIFVMSHKNALQSLCCLFKTRR